MRFSPVEWGLVRERARVCGRPPTTYLREVGLGAIPRARPGAVERQVVHHLSRIGSNLEQLAYLARQGGLTTLARDFEATLVDLRNLLRRLLR